MKMRSLIVLSTVLVLFTATVEGRQVSPAYGDTEYRLGPDDVIQIFVYKEADLSATVVVRPDGKVSLPLIGELPGSGRTAIELQYEIGQRLAQYIAEPVVNVIVKEVNSAKVSVLGEVKTPGVYKIENRATVVDVIAKAGGFTEYAKRDKVTVIRVLSSGEQERIKLNIEQLLKSQGDLFYVLPHDKIFVQ
jgi:polysaccharide export outer membrane protein